MRAVTWALALGVLLAALVTASGCETLTPNKTAAATVDGILALSDEVDLAEKRGWITNEREDELQNRLLVALGVVRSTYTLEAVPGCEQTASRQECLQQILLEVEMELRERQGGDL